MRLNETANVIERRKSRRGSILLIPDGMRRYASKHGIDLAESYRIAGIRLLKLSVKLLAEFDVIGLYVLASYNLQRPQKELRPLLQSGLDALTNLRRYLSARTRVVIIGNIELLISVDPSYAKIIAKYEVNPHNYGAPVSGCNILVIYLCYDWFLYIRDIFEVCNSIAHLHTFIPQWSHVIRTGCPDRITRLSGIFLGIDNARISSTVRLFNELRYADIKNIIRKQRRSIDNVC